MTCWQVRAFVMPAEPIEIGLVTAHATTTSVSGWMTSIRTRPVDVVNGPLPVPDLGVGGLLAALGDARLIDRYARRRLQLVASREGRMVANVRVTGWRLSPGSRAQRLLSAGSMLLALAADVCSLAGWPTAFAAAVVAALVLAVLAGVLYTTGRGRGRCPRGEG